MRKHPTAIEGPVLLEPTVHGDQRGFFLETWNERLFADFGVTDRFVQDNHSRSARGVLRGIHYQLAHPQGKLVRVTAGAVFDVAVDLRRSSPQFGKWTGVHLSAANKLMLWIPPGFGHGFLALEDDTDFLYKCTDFYFPVDERTIAWDDPDIGIEWPLGLLAPVISKRDQDGAALVRAETYP